MFTFNFAENKLENVEQKQSEQSSLEQAEEAVSRLGKQNEKFAIKLDSIHIKEERFSVANKTGMSATVNIK